MITNESFNHGLVASKLWLCQELETILDNRAIRNPIVHVLAGWNNLLGFMMLTRRPNFYGVVHSYDIDTQAVHDADIICDYWNYEYPKVYNHARDINSLDFSSSGRESVFINCSVDQLKDNEWYNRIPVGSLVCLQATNMPTDNKMWHVHQSFESIIDLTETFKVGELLYANTKSITYSHLQYKRHMMIGIK